VILEVPRAEAAAYQHCLDAYASESNNLAATWLHFRVEDWDLRPGPQAATFGEMLQHDFLRDHGSFGSHDPNEGPHLPATRTSRAFAEILWEMASSRFRRLAAWTEEDWLRKIEFPDCIRDRAATLCRQIEHYQDGRTQFDPYLPAQRRTRTGQ
jgi:hypothetical protein